MDQAADLYHIIAAGSGWVDRRDRGRLRIAGRDARSFLHALLTNDIESLQPGQSAYAAYLTAQGRMIADVTIHHAGDFLLADVPHGLAPALATRLDLLIFSEDVRVSDVTAAMYHITIVGPAGDAVLAGLPSGDALVARGPDVGLPTLEVFGDAPLLDGLIRRIEEAGAVAVPWELFDGLRIEAGRPAFGVDMTEETIPLEAGLLDRAISTSKGCYVGQEIIVRVLHRGGGRVAKRLVKIVFDSSVTTPPAIGSPLEVDGAEVGRITSVAVSPTRGQVVALGYVRRDEAEPERKITIRTDRGKATGRIVGLAG